MGVGISPNPRGDLVGIEKGFWGPQGRKHGGGGGRCFVKQVHVAWACTKPPRASLSSEALCSLLNNSCVCLMIHWVDQRWRSLS